ncbi:lipid IV(A) 3-deoxy-D-manno-octulosonic acid transferase [sulfur-oxidizing endosymbiont of Gigantopelta aegis]|uniref:lipid IV(A) 3-deoxy-D-manno-octulosonic acid transferase n=1 Tax=sulfur-oxidizing endosymbiont of Gigantopelta aegis TaxID=2794934 RepID=UPI0018DBD545|nr:lipid IV(A) 3-deoxy-D-manno-octulosonic acid transferase [sulfur-oxidizing endosymbiont of Gigantopelta aegis]
MPRFFYTLVYYSLVPFLFLRLLLKHQKSNDYKDQRQALRLAERLGFFRPPVFIERPIWIHTVSVGEFLATLPLLKQLQEKYNHYPIVITCTTTTGSAQICKTFAQEIQQGRVFHVYLPYDLPGAMRRFMQALKPRLAIIMETEIWPNLLTVAEQQEIPVCLLNARMSPRSAKGYARIKRLIAPSLKQLSFIAAQDSMDAKRLINLGAEESHLAITGSIKYDLKLNSDDIAYGKSLREQLNWQDRKVLIAASTHQGEDEMLLSVYRQLKKQYDNLSLIIVPRHPERFQSVYQLLNVDALNVLKRSQMNAAFDLPVDILLGDSMGEMIRYFACADIVFMGGTLVKTGGHNILEPAALGLPIIYGPHMFNFNAINALFLQHQAVQQVADEQQLKAGLEEMLLDETQAHEMGARAKELMAKNAGAVDKMMQSIQIFLT